MAVLCSTASENMSRQDCDSFFYYPKCQHTKQTSVFHLPNQKLYKKLINAIKGKLGKLTFFVA